MLWIDAELQKFTFRFRLRSSRLISISDIFFFADSLTIEWVVSNNEKGCWRQGCFVLLSDPFKVRLFFLRILANKTNPHSSFRRQNIIPGTYSHHGPMTSSCSWDRTFQSKLHTLCCMKDCCCLDFLWSTFNQIRGKTVSNPWPENRWYP